MITAIPNQPVNFSGSLLAGCVCDPLVPATVIDPANDSLIFQTLIDLCPEQTNEIDPDFTAANWDPRFWTLGVGSACAINTAGAMLLETSFVPTPGTSYMLRFTRVETTGTATWYLGGSTGTLGIAGTTTTNGYTFVVDADAVNGLQIVLDNALSSICIGLIEIYELTRDIVVELIPEGGGPALMSWTPILDPDAFQFVGQFMIFDAAITDAEGCFTVRVTETCNAIETVLESQTFISTDDDCTLKLRACGQVSGFYDYPFEIRLSAKLTHPTTEYEVSEQRRSNGTTVRNYVDARLSMEFRVGLQSEFVHPFLAMLPLFPSVYIGQQQFTFDAEGYAPGYSDVFDGTGTVIMTVRPTTEKRRYVACDDVNKGCPPPPNYWVQWTGPNDDLILTEDGYAIQIIP